MRFVIRLLISAVALWVATQIVPGVSYKGELVYLLLVALSPHDDLGVGGDEDERGSGAPAVEPVDERL